MTTTLAAMKDAALRAGQEIMDVYRNFADGLEVQHKTDDSPLTNADMRAHAAIREHLQQHCPHIPQLSEESPPEQIAERRSWQRFFLIDPLDGTKEFLKRNGEFTVNIALIDSGVPLLGVVYAPALAQLYVGDVGAQRAERSHLNTGQLGEPQRLPLADSAQRPYRVVASRSHMNDATRQYIDQLRQQHPDCETTSIGSSLKLCLVAEGSADAYPRFGPTMEWDTAAAHAVVAASGAQVRRADTGAPLEYNKADLLNPHFVVERPAESSPETNADR